jgi:hypothetical protein
MRGAFVTTVLAAVGFLLNSQLVCGQARQPSRPAAITSVAEAGPDYALQGEYAGWMYVPGRGNEYAGLQVVALGGGKFDAVHYRGGLPGNGWDRATKSKLSGQVAIGGLVLDGPAERLIVANRVAVPVDSTGQELGRLIKVTRTSPTMGLVPPQGATVLFDGRSTDQFRPGAKMTPDGHLQTDAFTKMDVGAFRLHLEFRTPYVPQARGQERGNAGVYIQRRYEVQILDSFGLEGAFNEAGALYRQTPPDLNMALPPLTWQTYDIWFTPPRFDADSKKKIANARITVLHNGVPVHWHREVTAKTGGGQQEGPTLLPIYLQGHGNPVVYRNIWIVPGEGDTNWQTASSGSSAGCCQCCRARLFHRRRCS